jgi:hypothetical protein
MWLHDWLFEILVYVCAIATLANASWDFRQAGAKGNTVVQQANRPD